MIKNFFYRFLLVVTLIYGIIFACSTPDDSHFTNWFIFGIGLVILIGMCFYSFKNLSQERINEILCLNFFKKIGCDFTEE